MTSIDCFTVRWRLAEGEPKRDDVLDALLSGALDDALEACRIGCDEEIAIASVDVEPQRIGTGQSVADAAVVWAEAVAAAVTARITTGGPGVVRYPNRVAAVSDLVLSLTNGDSARMWAWRRLGLPSGGSGSEIVCGGLIEVAGQAPALVAALARAGRLPALVDLVGTAGVSRIAAAAWRALSADPITADAMTADFTVGSTAADRIDADRPNVGPTYVDSPTGAPNDAVAADGTGHDHVAAASEPLRATELLQDRVMTSPLARFACEATDPVLATALAALAVADTEPAVVSRGEGGPLVAALVTGRPVLDSSRIRQETDVSASPAALALPSSGETAGAESTSDPTIVDRRRHTTANAGVLFVLHVLEDPLESRWAYYHLAQELVARSSMEGEPPATDDPALLVFCGLPPGSEPPEQQPDDPVEARADAVIAAVRDRLTGRDLALCDDTALLAAIVRRRGAVVADPGWIEVELDLDEVSVDLRAAGLDLDPGWLPELGCVVRFRYV
ncbi:hypothetical protein SK803_14300 [Lentzea sp. BCCO 10_0856]|uniref:Uncharacterized protein n=1 Tax=Lentzea miocenica TaxID=3095431 RepID=A0ABU4SZR0_9PSEU|nr:hypothetical protein [Lentzea sp. BCCO 10_0856]MDX8031396.1 hypothetical protein [Lentzea sp. BCCO 10_0856]